MPSVCPRGLQRARPQAALELHPPQARGWGTPARYIPHMSFPDARDNPCSSSHAAARDAVEQALWQMMAFYDTPLADLDAATAADPGWMLPHVMKAGFLLSLTEAPLQREAEAHLAQARCLAHHANAREKAHLEAVQQVFEGRWQAACRIWGELLVEQVKFLVAGIVSLPGIPKSCGL